MLGSLPVLGHAINAFARTLHSTQIVVVLPEGQIDFWKNLAARFDIAKQHLHGGRAATVPLGTQRPVRSAPNRRTDRGPRRRTSFGIVRPDFESRGVCGGPWYCYSGRRSRRFLRQLTPDGSHPIDRNTLRIVQTPQVFDAELLRRAYELDYSPTSPTTPRSSNGRDMRSRSATESAAT